MLASTALYAVVPVKDTARAKQFYKEKLGLEPKQELYDGYMYIYECGNGTTFCMYQTDNAGTAKSTAMGWSVQDLDSEMSSLKQQGVVFEEYDMPGLKTENGVATMGKDRSAWFKDSEGNILCLSQMGA